MNYLQFHPSSDDQYSVVRWTAPAQGVYTLQGAFIGLDYSGPTTTDVHVLHNDKSLFDAYIDGYGGDPSFHKVEGASPTADYSGQVSMKKNDILTFAIGWGRNKTNSCDTTGLFAKVVLLDDMRETGTH